MSYILEALKKSEAERNRRNAPMRLVNDPGPGARRRALWPRVLTLVLLINLLVGAGAWWYLQPDAPGQRSVATPELGEERADEQETGAAAAAPPPSGERAEQPPGRPSGEATRIEPERRVAHAPLGAVRGEAPREGGQMEAASRAAEPQGRVLRFQSLPLEERARFPQLEFSSHLYASDPSMRRVVVNERRAHEGDTLAQGVTLEEITQSGVVVRYRDRRVAIDVTGAWQP